ncbi:cytoplasmic protein [Cryptococcus neoformans C23]|uniref:Cytoplasmic protein n=2 Tax=Cryptococcus neoformans TaxID=5207 RepID=A0A854QJT8_CRYNE|nr:cytoplasmic protein [Cryptococcus neoformans var. grubii H99]AUB25163.1 cytoplasmic protein [Cryptococcus neoformans var. grubii]OWZ42567.1 cytoplasmic protein [Cryptococcus neoformans var. grubii AD1-83a]OWZ43598.1 cytoplasmic protein [Cryptococcus neoformans var. grubii C23]OWZ54282.1 cytoplasmic protein [Cryptococcus neoformans var. grubii 125.91]OWZ77779.1 cytoplasmic protein [Cryptococcus neoformans var. grubii Bt85]OXG20694.1 cytoplasmic protein [Cryptococcus neoformans var. grubii T|eukprot:XP_012049702.1 cytoplasmic protein [Cryptococcus neoformans var. grubii H99]
MEDEQVPQLLVSTPEVGISSLPPARFERPQVPITLLTGYLGAGKSTLLQYILTASHGYRIAVCMNDFGDTTDIESKSLTMSDPNSSTTTSEFLSLPNGCLCCSVKDMGIAAIEDMVMKAPGGVDWVVVELTGLADPTPIVKSFWSNEEMGDLFLDGVVCVVDSRNVLKQLDGEKDYNEITECQKQVASADVILLNKIDLVSEEHLSKVERAVRELNATLRIHYTKNSQAPISELFHIRAFTNSVTPAIKEAPAALDDDHQHSSDCGHPHEGGELLPHRNARINTTLIPIPPLNLLQYNKLNTFLEFVLWSATFPASSKVAPEILRTKGYITLQDDRAFVLQGVADLFELKEVDRALDPEMEGKIVFIGKGVGEDLKRELQMWVGL